MLPPFHIRNLQSPLDLIYVSIARYEETLSTNLRTALRYDDDDGDVITIGSSFELEQKLGEKPSANQQRQLAELHKSQKPIADIELLHVFNIDSDDRVQKVWDELRKSSRISPQRPRGDDDISSMRSTLYEPSLGRTISSEHTVGINVSETFQSYLPIVAKQRESLHSPATENPRATTFENRKDHHFNTTNPPQLPLPGKISDDSSILVARAEDRAVADLPPPEGPSDATNVRGQRAMVNVEHGMLAANLTYEGRRQAQIAGEKLRARELCTRPRKVSFGQTNRLNYHNRWASYKSSENPKTFLSGLTPESKRQAQTPGDRLYSRNNRIRHGVKGLSYSGDAVGGNRGFDTKPQPTTTPNKAESTGKTNQKSLLEVFESELTKHSKDSACQTEFPFFPSGKVPSPMIPICTEQTKPVVATARLPVPQPMHTSVEDGIKNALSGFEACLRGIVETLKAAQPSRSDNEILADTMKAFHGLTEKASPQHIISSDADRYTKSPQADPKAGSVSENTESLDLHFPVMTAYAPMNPETWKDHGTKMESNESAFLPMLALVASNPRVRPEEPRFNKQRPYSDSDFADQFQYHRQGPIHLPQQDPTKKNFPSTQLGGELRTRSSFADQPRRLDSEDISKNSLATLSQHDSNPQDLVGHDRSISPTAVTTRFPTIGQFENSTFSKNFTASLSSPLIDYKSEASPDLLPAIKSGTALNETKVLSQSSDRMNAVHIPMGAAPTLPTLPKKQPLTRISGMSDSSGTDKARLLRPFDAFAAEGATQSQRNGFVRRSATTATPNLRRPHSEVFHGNNRVTWDPLTSQQSSEEGKIKQGSNEFPSAKASSMSLPLPVLSREPSKPVPLSKPLGTSQMHRSATDAGARREPNLRPQDIKIRKCIDNLRGLGFALDRSRLRVYASVANGDLHEAIDMLTEDQKVHENRD